MAAKFVNIDRDTPMIMPPDMRDWVPENHMVHFIIEAVERISLSGAAVNHRGTGSAQYPPAMMIALLIYCYCSGVFSSRQIERLTHENVAVRFLCGDSHPDHDSICAFRRNNGELFKSVWHQALELAAEMKMLRVGDITLSVDGTKIYANASKHSALSHGHIIKQIPLLEEPIRELTAKAEAADSTPLQDGLTIPEEIARREDRIRKILEAKAEIEARDKVRFEREMAGHEGKIAERERKTAATGKAPRGRKPKEPDAAVPASAQVNLTDPESRIMPVGGSKDFGQCYNAQAGVETGGRFIVAEGVVQDANDREQLVPVVASVAPVAGNIANVLVDSGYYSEKAVAAVETDAEGRPTGTTVYAATGREPHGRTVADLEKRDDPEPPGERASAKQKMKHRTKTKAGKALYKQRMATVEPVFGIIKSVMGFRRFSMRGLAKAGLEWTLVTLSYNLKRLFTLKQAMKAA